MPFIARLNVVPIPTGKEGPYSDLREKLKRKDLQGSSKKPQSWDRQRDMRHNFKKRPYSPPHRELVRCT
ncbi:hypothetical protein LIER_24651 [Lithospermum erythrorhizon]|uniref:Uncharacterized protein n=1 Tax=Lithospermum erythrorhizon TaxID=34254 RepID=A0AAV3R5K8_LITER